MDYAVQDFRWEVSPNLRVCHVGGMMVWKKHVRSEDLTTLTRLCPCRVSEMAVLYSRGLS